MCEESGSLIFIEIVYSLFAFFLVIAVSLALRRLFKLFANSDIDRVGVIFAVYFLFSQFIAKDFLQSRLDRGLSDVVLETVVEYHVFFALIPLTAFLGVFLILRSRRIAEVLFLVLIYLYMFYMYRGGLYLCQSV